MYGLLRRASSPEKGEACSRWLRLRCLQVSFCRGLFDGQTIGPYDPYLGYPVPLNALDKALLRCAGPMVTALAVSAPAPHLIDPWTVGMTYPDVSVVLGQSVEFKWPGRGTDSRT